jgi:hypothetical protein
MEVRAEKKMAKTKTKPNVNNQKMLTVVPCWLTEGQEQDEKRPPILWTERNNRCSHGGWFTLALI